MDINSGISSAVDYLDGTSIVSLFKNPIMVAALITIVILIIVVITYDNNKIIKTGFYIFFSSLVLIFLHNKVLIKEHRRQLCSADQQAICNNINNITGGSINIGEKTGADELEYLTN